MLGVFRLLLLFYILGLMLKLNDQVKNDCNNQDFETS